MAKPIVTVRKECDYSPEIGLDLGAWGYRLTFDPQIEEQPRYLESCLNAGLETCLSADTDTFRTIPWNDVRANPWDEGLYLDELERCIKSLQLDYDGLLTYLHCWNEFNDPGTEGSRMHPVVVNNATRLFARYFPNARLISASDVTGDVESFAALDLSMTPILGVDLYDSSPYVWTDQKSGYLGDKISNYQRRWPGYKIAVIEFGQSSWEHPPDVDGDDYQATYVKDSVLELGERTDLEFFGLYAVQNWKGFGLLDDNGKEKRSYYFFRESAANATGEHLPPTPKAGGEEPQPQPRYQFVQGFARINDLYPGVLGEPLENEVPIVQGLATQRTSNGDLTWANVQDRGEVFTFTTRSNGDRYRWSRQDLGL